MTVCEWISCFLILSGAFFFLAGSLGLLRFPDALTRLHALTKADNLGLGFIVAALVLQANSWNTVVKYIIIWLLVLLSSATVSCLIANHIRNKNHQKEQRK